MENMILTTSYKNLRPSFFIILYIYMCHMCSFSLWNIKEEQESITGANGNKGWFPWEHLQKVQATTSHGSCSDRLYIFIFYHRSFLQSWDESSCLHNLQTHCSRSSHVPFCLFSWKVRIYFPLSIISVWRWRAKCMLSVFKLVVRDWFYLWYINYMIYQNIIFESFLKNRMESGLTKSFAVLTIWHLLMCLWHLIIKPFIFHYNY